MKPWLSYSIIRVVLFAGVFVILMLTAYNSLIAANTPGWIAGSIVTLLAAIISLTISYIFFRPARDALARSIVERRAHSAPEPNSDEFAEDDETRA